MSFASIQCSRSRSKASTDVGEMLFPVNIADALALCRGKRVGNEAAHRLRVSVVIVWLAWPEEPAQPVAATARDYVNVEVGHALADDSVRCDKGAGSVHGAAHRDRHSLHDLEDGGQLWRR